LTATAFSAFAEEKVNVGIIECGMGGRLDSTNVLVNPIVTVITRLGFDHQAFLGGTAEAIAMEKSGIMRKNVPCVLDSTSEPGFINEVIRQATMKDAPITLTHFAPLHHSEESRSLAKNPNEPPKAQLKDLPLATQSTPFNQPEQFLDTIANINQQTITELNNIPETAFSNMWTAYLAFHQALSQFSLPLPTSPSATFETMLQTPNPGRYQHAHIKSLTGRTNPIILDGAHNTQAFKALVQQVDRLRKDAAESVTWVLASTDSRDPSDLLALIPAQDKVVATTFTSVEGMPWVRPFALQQWRKILEAERVTWCVEEHAGAALSAAVDFAIEGPLIVAGSLYLVADVLRVIEKQTDMQDRND